MKISAPLPAPASAEFAAKLADADDEQEKLKLIGQFGVGFYSVFMVADRVVITTRSADPEADGVLWESTGDGAYTLSQADKADRGTEIKIYIRSDCEEFLDAHRLEAIIRKHSDFVAYPIKVANKQVNDTAALWTRPRNEITPEQYNEFYTHLTGDPDEPLAREHIVVGCADPILRRALHPQAHPNPMAAHRADHLAQPARCSGLYPRRLQGAFAAVAALCARSG